MTAPPAASGAGSQPASPVADPALDDSLAALLASESAARRTDRPGQVDTPAATRIGLALSGGGVRSATFALGLMRGLAQERHPGTGAES